VMVGQLQDGGFAVGHTAPAPTPQPETTPDGPPHSGTKLCAPDASHCNGGRSNTWRLSTTTARPKGR